MRLSLSLMLLLQILLYAENDTTELFHPAAVIHCLLVAPQSKDEGHWVLINDRWCWQSNDVPKKWVQKKDPERDYTNFRYERDQDELEHLRGKPN